MPPPRRDPSDLVAYLRELEKRIERLEGRTGFREFSTADRPAPAEFRGIIFNVTVGKHQASTGAAWFDLY